MAIARLDEIPHLSVEVAPGDQDDLMNLIQSALGVANNLAANEFPNSIVLKGFSGRALNVATMAAAQSVNSLLAAVSAKCNLAAPPEEIEMKMKGGDLIYRCYHDPAHEWNLSGTRIV